MSQTENAYPWLPPAAHPAALQPRQSVFPGPDIPEHHPTPKNAPTADLRDPVDRATHRTGGWFRMSETRRSRAEGGGKSTDTPRSGARAS